MKLLLKLCILACLGYLVLSKETEEAILPSMLSSDDSQRSSSIAMRHFLADENDATKSPISPALENPLKPLKPVSPEFILDIEKAIGNTLQYFNGTVGTLAVDATFCLSATAELLQGSPFGEIASSLLNRDVKVQKTKYAKDFNKFKKVVEQFPSWTIGNEISEHIQDLKDIQDVEEAIENLEEAVENSDHAINEDATRRNKWQNLDDYVGLSRLTKKRHRRHKRNYHVLESFLRKIPKVTKCAFNEDLSDKCLQQATNCKLTAECMAFNTISRIKSGYCLTHQMLYYEFFRRFCPKTEASTLAFATEAIKLLTHELFIEVQEVKLDEKWSDEWIERYALGCMVGAYQFIQEDIVRYVIDQQLKVGCWRGDDEITFGKYVASKVGSSDEDLLEYETGNECVNHTTGLALYYLSAALAYYSRY